MYIFDAIVVLTFIHMVLAAFNVDDLPVLEYLGCNNCLRVYAPVCGSDNKTYTNVCRLNCANSKRNKGEWVNIIRYGPCVNVGAEFEWR